MGTWFNDYVGIEGGWTFTAHNSRVAYNDTMELGVPINPNAAPPEFMVNKSTLIIKGPHIGIVGQLPIWQNLGLFGSVGLSILKITAINRKLSDMNGVTPPDEQDAQEKKFASRRAIPTFGIGIIYPISEKLTIRLLARYELTEKFKNMHCHFKDGTRSRSNLSFKNNLLFGLGIAHHF